MAGMDWWRSKAAYFAWRIAHPKAPFREFYVRQVESRLDSGEVHVTLGARSALSPRFLASGRAQLDLLVREGLRPDERVVEFGCGSLRVGRHLIAYLDPEGYAGFDLVDRFWREGLVTVDADLLAEKRPRFALIEPAALEREAQRPPDVVVSIGVVIHVPPEELDEYFGSLARLFGPTTRGYVGFLTAAGERRISHLTWTHAEERLVAACARSGLAAAGFALDEISPSRHAGVEKRMLRLRRR